MEIRNHIYNIERRWEQFNRFILAIETGETFMWFHPDWGMMDWKTYRKISGHENGYSIKKIIIDEVADFPKKE